MNLLVETRRFMTLSSLAGGMKDVSQQRFCP